MPRVIPIDEIEKLAKAEAAQDQPSRAKRIAKKVGLGAAAVGGAAGLALLAMRPSTRKKVFEAAKNPRRAWQGFKKNFHGESSGPRPGAGRSRSGPRPGAGGGGRGGGNPFHERAQQQQSAYKEYGLHEAKTKSEFRKKWNEHAMKHHPDRGGDQEKMKHVNATFEAFKKSPEYEKLAMARYWAALAAALVR
jgi:hypothetical protein